MAMLVIDLINTKEQTCRRMVFIKSFWQTLQSWEWLHREAGGEIKNKGMENEELVRDGDEENERKLKWIHKPRINKN